MLSYRILAGLEELLHKGLVHHGNTLRSCRIGGRKRSPANDPLANCLEVIRTCPIEHSGHILSGIRRALPLDVDVEAPDIAVEWRVDGQADTLHTGQGVEPVFDLLIEALQLFRLVAGLQGIHADDNPVACLQAEILMLKFVEAFAQ